MSPRNILATLIVLALSACASDRPDTFDPCGARAGGWKLSPEVPANSQELLALDSGGQPVREQLKSAIHLSELWFSDGPDRLMVCRYEAGSDVCPVAVTAEFTRKSNRWS